MKELSIEEKAKRYDKALEKARQLCTYPTSKPFISDLQDLFPELKESEGREIRNWLIGYFQQYKSDGVVKFANGLKIDSIIAWLEKQDNNADKVEPKFNVGDWVVTDLFNIVQIKAIDNDKYVLEDTMRFSISVDYADYWWHRWTIQDAKDGDVLYSLDSCQPFIYKGRKPHEQATAYCGINKYDKFFVEKTEDYIIVLDKYVPATKEQSDFLFRKMKEAGYEWDADEKVVNKVIIYE